MALCAPLRPPLGRGRAYGTAMAWALAFGSLLASAEEPGGGQGSSNCGQEGAGECSASLGHGEKPQDFFRSYASAWVQSEMLQDEERTRGFREAIIGNRALFEGKVVLDVGAGTGILSFFAAQAGASRVFAVERSDMASIARSIAADNNLGHIVQVVQGLIEEVELPVAQVDIIISEWIGTFLIHESMLDSVLFARDKWLAPDGLMLPDSAELFVAGAEDQGADYDSWKDFYGLDFSALGLAARQVAAQQCIFSNSLATQPGLVLELDLYRMAAKDQVFSTQVRLSSSHSDQREVHALVSWFNLSFFNASASRCSICSKAETSVLTTHPNAPCTHWQQTLFSLAEPLQLESGTSLGIDLAVQRADGAPRDLDVALALSVGGAPVLQDRFHIVGADV